MTLPPVNFLKDQANRLSAHLGDKHRFRLKMASALEAVAAIYRQPDWNTLRALAGRDPGSCATARSVDTYPLTWSSTNQADLSLSAEDWHRHTIAYGLSAVCRRSWLTQQLMAQLERAAPGVFVNVFGPEYAGVRDVGLNFTQVLTSSTQPGAVPPARTTPSAALTINLMADLAPREIAEMLVELIFSEGRHRPDDYWASSASQVLALIAGGLREVGDTVTLGSLCEILPEVGLPRLRSLAERLPEASTVKMGLFKLVDSFDTPSGLFSQNTWASHSAVLTKGLASLVRAQWTRSFFSNAADAPGIFSLLSAGKCLSVDLPDGPGDNSGIATLHALKSACTSRLSMSRDGLPAWVFGLGEVANYLSPVLLPMAQQARAGRVALLLTAPHEDFFRNGSASGLGGLATQTGRAVLANIANTVYLQGCSQEHLMQLIAQAGNGPVLVQPGRLTVPLGL